MNEQLNSDAGRTTRRSPRIAVIGGGMSGILTAIKLQAAGITDFTVYEKADRLGGTWRENTYPGLSCDVPSHMYRYSFAPNAEWSHRFSPGAEIQAYFESVAKQYNVESFVSFNSEITRAAYRDGKWHLEIGGEEIDVVDIVISATGVLHHPVYPDIAGLDDFAGAVFHSARWNHEAPLDGKRIGIVGTGSTAVQITADIVHRAKHLSLFQRTAQWIFPQENPAFSEQEKEVFRHQPQAMDDLHASLTRLFADTFGRAVIGDKAQMQRVEDACLANLEDNVRDPELKARLTPDYQAACKRLIVSDGFYEAIQQPNAELVTAPIERVEAAGLRTGDGRLHELDVLVLATGFDGHSFMRPMALIGKDGVDLKDVWAEATQAHRSIAIPGFPNFFMLVGPNSPIGNFSLIDISERQLGYIMQLIESWRSGAAREISARQDATDRFNAALKEAMKDTVWVTGCQSWYLDKNGNPAMWPFTFDRFCEDMAAPNLEEYDLVS
ncbi:MAG: NAD(P)/FAD-dependent oxidoreductase [Proteobacteria bacterium]|nr:NAD(P)/FAD-dependent oxidoreductase [Pseudomonadota bacterium]